MNRVAEAVTPPGATHVSEVYGALHYYKEVHRPHLNQVSEEWQTLTSWLTWNLKKQQWECVGEGFSSRRLKPL